MLQSAAYNEGETVGFAAMQNRSADRLTFGPVPSRRLGRSLGINNIPPKACSYSCIYCQLGPTRTTEIVPRFFYTPDQIFQAVKKHLAQVREKGEQVDYLTFVPDGEPALDACLGESIEALRTLGIPVAIISNASLIWREEVRDALAKADWVSLKVDAADETLWRKINRPHPALDHRAILDGIMVFAGKYAGVLATESMLVRGMNDNAEAASELADFLGKLSPALSYLSVPIRPPSEKSVRVPEEAALNLVYQTVSRHVDRVELLTAYEGNAFAATGDLVEDLLSITAVHPMREEAVRELLSNTDWGVVQRLIDGGQLVRTEYEGTKFYMRRLEQERPPP